MPDDSTNPPGGGRPTGGGGVTSAPPTTGIRPVTAVTAGTRIIGTYEIEKLINTGGMGEVYRGRNIHDGEPVAIKIVLPHLAQDEMIVQLFQKEAKVLNRLVHDAIVRYYVFTNDPEIGRPCMIMEFIEGTSMNERMKQGPMALDEVKVLLRRLASGLDKAHSMGVVHRDLSPDNVILQGGSVEHAKIIDFGIAKSTMKGDATLLQGQFAGKFSYVAPEQLGAYGGNVDGRADIYSLALMMVAVAQGRVLNMGKSIVEAVRARAHVPDLSGVYPELRPLLSHMLEPDPQNRPGSMAEVIRLLDDPSLIPAAPEPGGEEDDPDRTRIVRVPLPAGGGGASQPPQQTGGTKPGASDALFVGIPDPKAAAPAPAKKSSAGLAVVLVAVLALAGATGAWVAGVFDGDDPEPGPVGPLAGTPGGQTTPEPGPAPEPEPQPDPQPEPAPDPQPEPQPEPEPGPTPGTEGGPTPPPPTPEGEDPSSTIPETPPPQPEPEPEPQPQPEPEPVPEPEPQPPADPLQVQTDWLRAYAAGPCTLLRTVSAQGDRVGLEVFAPSIQPITRLLADFTAAHGYEPAITPRVITDPLCPVIDYAASLRDTPALPAAVLLNGGVETVRSGEKVEGRIEGLAGRAVSLFLVNGTGGSTNLKPFLTPAADGTMAFSFIVNLTPGAEPTPQLLMAVVTDQPVTKLDAVPNGVTARALVPFMTSEIGRTRQDTTVALQYFRLQH